MKDISLEIIPGTFAICRLPREAAAPLSEWSFAARTPEELSLVCLEKEIPEGAEKTARGYACMRVQGTLDLSLTGILRRIADALCDAGIPIFAVSTFDTDYVFVPEKSLEPARRALREKGMRSF